MKSRMPPAGSLFSQLIHHLLIRAGEYEITTLPSLVRKAVTILLVVLLSVPASVDGQFNFTTSQLNGASITSPTSLQFGPDGRLYVAQQDGIIKCFTIVRTGDNVYTVTNTETLTHINQIPNHNDDGTLAPEITTRQVTSLLVAGTPENPILYVTSSDSRIGGPTGDLNLDTNSGIISMLTWNGSAWIKVDLVRGLPRSEENHSTNGMQLDETTNMLYLAVGGMTNAGGPSVNFAYATEYALAAAILSVDLNAINALPTIGSGNTAYKYDLPTVDDPTRPNVGGKDVNDPFGGNDGLNQARIVPGGPVQIFAPGFRNAYDLLITKTLGKAGRIYTIDNGANQGWGGYPQNEGPGGNATNNYVVGEPGSTGPGINEAQVNNLDNFHYIGNIATYQPGSYYGGHPTPIRANPFGAGLYTHNGVTGVFRTLTTGPNPLPADWPPVTTANPVESDFLMPGSANSPSLLTFTHSTNGIAEYTASNFSNVLKGTILAASFDGNLYKITPTPDGTNVTNAMNPLNKLNQDAPFASGFGSIPLDVVAQGDDEIFPGTVWVAMYGSNSIVVFEPADMVNCTGLDNEMDDDNDGYTNADEIDNNTDPCSAASRPPDFDQDGISDLNDPDDDNDGIPDTEDPFAIDPNNGSTTTLPIVYNLFNNDPNTGFFGVGFNGLMVNGTDYLNLFDPNNLIAGGAVGAFSIIDVSPGDAFGAINTQQNAFQFGLRLPYATTTVHSRMLGPFFNGLTPASFQSQGIYIGTGDQSNYLKIVLNANGGAWGIQVVHENNDAASTTQFALPGALPDATVDFYFVINPVNGTVQPQVSVDGGTITNVGSPILLQGALLQAMNGSSSIAIGIIATSRGSTPFTATWDYIYVNAGDVNEAWQGIAPSALAKWLGHSVTVNNKLYVFSGFDNQVLNTSPKNEVYNPATNSWSYIADMPQPVTHAGIAVDGSNIYVAGGFIGGAPGSLNSNLLQIYNVNTNTWTTGPPLPAVMGGHALARVGRKLYAFGGLAPDRQTGSTLHYMLNLDNLAGGWSPLPGMPIPRCHFATGVVAGKIYALGGQSGHDGAVSDLNVAHVFDPSVNQWSAIANLPTIRSHSETSTFVYHGKIVLVGGRSGITGSVENVINKVSVFDPLLGTWTDDVPLPQNLLAPAAEVIGSQLFVTNGGLNGSANLQSAGYKRGLDISPVLQMGFNPSALNFSTPAGTSANTTVTLWVLSGSPVYTINTASLPAWLSVSTSGGVIDLAGGTNLTITANALSLVPGNYNAVITASAPGYPQANLTVSLTVTTPQALYRINAGGPQLTTSMGTFAADNYFSPTPGNVFSVGTGIGNTTDDALYQTERYGTNSVFNYAFPVANGSYTVVLHFAELFWTATNKRLFDIVIEGNLVKDNFDIFAKVGAFYATTETFQVNVSDGTLNILFSALPGVGGIDNPKVSAIEIFGGGTNIPPVAEAGPNQTITLPVNSVTLSGTATDDGQITSYAWNKVSGPTGGSIANPGSASTNVSGLTEGVYVFRLTVTDNGTPALSHFDDVTITVNGALTGTGSWQTIAPTSGTVETREESSFIEAGNRFYLLGGRGIDPVQEYDPVNKTWTNKAPVPMELHHFQAVNINGLIYAAGAFTGSYPRETPVANIHIYNPASNIWYVGPQIPVARRRGSAGAFARNNKLYLVCGIVDGHWTNSVTWFDEYDPATNTWTALPNAPRVRDHFHAAVLNNKLYLVGGRRSSASTGEVFNLTIPEVDVYDFNTGQWSTLPAGSNLPVPRAGGTTAVLGSEVIMIGGESSQAVAHNQTHALDPQTNAWRNLANMVQGRHGIQAIESNNGLYVVAGAGNQGGGNLLSSQEAFYFSNATTPNKPPLDQSDLGTAANYNFGSVSINQTATTDFTLSNAGGTQDILVTAISLSGSSAFELQSLPSLPFIIPVGQSKIIQVAFTPTSAGSHTGSVNISHSGESAAAAIALSGQGSGGSVVYRINAGGPLVNNSIGTFAADNYFSPVPGKTFTVSTPIAGTTDDLMYQSERFGTNQQMSYAFPVSNGSYTVVLHFAELFWTAANKRKFDITIEGVLVKDNFDIYAKVGAAFTATTEIFNVTVNDGVLDIHFNALANVGGADNPKVNAIEILQVTSNNPPVAEAGPNQTITLPTNSVTLSGSGTDDGSITGYAWTKLSGPPGGTIVSPSSASTNVTGLAEGVYVFRLTVTDDGIPALTGFDDVTITVQGGVVNNPPVAEAGPNQIILLPSTSVTLSGSGTDDGAITGYAWTKFSGPPGGTIVSPSSASTTVTGLTEGIYVFRLTVTDNGTPPLTGFDDVTISVQADEVNDPPVAEAGPNQTITLPTSSVILSGSGTDDGVITAYAWTQFSGPSPATIVSPSSASTSVTGLVQGTYVFRLTVTDNGAPALTDFDDVTITVNAAVGGSAVYRINAGGPLVNNSIGTFAADNYFSPVPGKTYSVGTGIAGTTDDPMYQTERYGTNQQMSYAFPVVNGNYTVVLHFAELFWTSVNKRKFDITIEGTLVKDNFDIFAKVGAFAATTEIFNVTVNDGVLNIHFNALASVGGLDNPKVSAIEILTSSSNNPPVAEAGPNQTITLPTNTAILSGSGTDDGSITGYAWTKLSGPPGGTIVSPSSASTSVTGLTEGVYVFRLTVTDNGIPALTGVDDVTITVQGGVVNNPPVAEAGPNQTITLPANSVTLSGSGTDDGVITAYAWTKFSGPSAGTIVSPNSASTSVTGLAEGVYVFRLTVTDNGTPALTHYDDVTVTVNPAVGGSAVYRINAGGPLVNNSIGTFAADNYFSPVPGKTYSVGTGIAGTTDDPMYQTERFGTNQQMSYAFPVVNGNYTVVLHFAELFWTAANKRKFDITIEGVLVKDNFDIFAKVGAFTATTEVFNVTVNDGVLNIHFNALASVGGTDNPKVSAIEILTVPMSVSRGTLELKEFQSSQIIRADDQSVKAYPNPSYTGRYRLSFGTALTEDVHYELTTAAGLRLKTGVVIISHPTSLVEMDFSSVMNSKGIYYLRIRTKNRLQTIALMHK